MVESIIEIIIDYTSQRHSKPVKIGGFGQKLIPPPPPEIGPKWTRNATYFWKALTDDDDESYEVKVILCEISGYVSVGSLTPDPDLTWWT